MGGGGGSYFPKQSKSLTKLLQQAQQQQDADIEINEYLRELLAKFNARDVEKINEYLDGLVKALGTKVEIDKLNFGGSVAKHTYVDGLSDVDALVVLDTDEHKGESPQELIDRFHQALKTKLSRAKVESIEKGKMAVTVVYDDGTEIQLLPAKKSGKEITIPNPERNGWKTVDPNAFRQKLTDANEKLKRPVGSDH
jgi:monoamine oxidase